MMRRRSIADAIHRKIAFDVLSAWTHHTSTKNDREAFLPITLNGVG